MMAGKPSPLPNYHRARINQPVLNEKRAPTAGCQGSSVKGASTQTGGGAAPSGPSQSFFINVQGKSRFTADEVNDLMEHLIERQRDGDQLVLVR